MEEGSEGEERYEKWWRERSKCREMESNRGGKEREEREE